MPKELPPGKVKPPSPEDVKKYLNKASKYLSNPDRRDYQRTIAGRGDTHALDGGTTPAHYASLVQRRKEHLIKGWEDRNRANNGTKLNPILRGQKVL